MAKKAKAAKKRAKAPRKAADAKVPLHAVVHFIRTLHKHKRAARFIAHAKQSNALVTVPAKSVAFVNKFVADHNLANTGSPTDVCPNGDPWKCQDRNT